MHCNVMLQPLYRIAQLQPVPLLLAQMNPSHGPSKFNDGRDRGVIDGRRAARLLPSVVSCLSDTEPELPVPSAMDVASVVVSVVVVVV